MVILGSDEQMASLAKDLLEKGLEVSFRASGWSMHPLVRSGDVLRVCPTPVTELGIGDIVLTVGRGEGLLAHRLIARQGVGQDIELTTRGDALSHADPPIATNRYLGRVRAITRRDRLIHEGSAGRRLLSQAQVRWPRVTNTLLQYAVGIKDRISRDRYSTQKSAESPES